LKQGCGDTYSHFIDLDGSSNHDAGLHVNRDFPQRNYCE
jgi:hypothetical protein